MLRRMLDLLNRLFKPLAELADSPRGLWYVIGAFVLEMTAYYGIWTLMTCYLSTDLKWSDNCASVVVSMFTMLATVFMLTIGSFAESFGPRRAIAAALLMNTVGRAVYCLLPGHSALATTAGAAFSLLLVAAGSGILTPACYSGIKQFTNEKTRSMGYAMIYALMNLGLVVMGALSAWLRPGVQVSLDHRDSGETGSPILQWFASFSGSGVNAVNWLCCGITGATLLVLLIVMTHNVEAARLRPESLPIATSGRKLPFASRLRSYFVGGPFTDLRFVFFIFMLLPVRTLFVHQMLTLPQYILRAYPQEVGNKMEWLVNGINPSIIVVGVPLVTMLTRRFHVYTMMIVGSFVTAAPAFLLCFGPDLGLLIAYFVLYSIGEALWSARFIEYVSELAPPGQMAQYMGLAQIPWMLVKGTTGLYSGYLLATCCPKGAALEQMHTGTMWLIYACIAMTTPIGLLLGRKWVQRGLQQPERPPV